MANAPPCGGPGGDKTSKGKNSSGAGEVLVEGIVYHIRTSGFEYKRRQDKARREKTRHDTTRPEKTRPEKTRHDTTRQSDAVHHIGECSENILT